MATEPLRTSLTETSSDMDVAPSSEFDSQAGQFESVLSSITGTTVGATSPKAVQSATSVNSDAKQPPRGYMWEDDAGYYYDDEESFTLRPVVDWSTR